MATQLSGRCLCGTIKLTASGTPLATVNCHCTDCRRSTGSVYGTVLYFEKHQVEVVGVLQQFDHRSDRDTVVIKHFCNNCGSQILAEALDWPEWIGIRAGCIDQTNRICPERNVFSDSKVASTPLDPDLPCLVGMPIATEK